MWPRPCNIELECFEKTARNLFFNMVYQIDQSGKIEQTNLHTILAFSNYHQVSIFFSKQNKRILLAFFRKQGKLRAFTVLTFTALLAILIKITSPVRHKIIIDHEYLSYEAHIKERLLIYLHILKLKPLPIIEFGHVGKTTRAHCYAAEVAHKKKKASKVIRLKEVLSLILRAQKRIGYPGINGTEGNLTQDWLPGGRKPTRSKKS